jgi:hypothetical protein
MEAENTTSERRTFTDEELRNAGASALYIAYYNEAGYKASARSEVERGPFTLEELDNTPNLGGGFFAALWRGYETKAFGRADSKNLSILESATARSKQEVMGWVRP